MSPYREPAEMPEKQETRMRFRVRWKRWCGLCQIVTSTVGVGAIADVWDTLRGSHGTMVAVSLLLVAGGFTKVVMIPDWWNADDAEGEGEP